MLMTLGVLFDEMRDVVAERSVLSSWALLGELLDRWREARLLLQAKIVGGEK